jgi:hypothetical protein
MLLERLSKRLIREVRSCKTVTEAIGWLRDKYGEDGTQQQVIATERGGPQKMVDKCNVIVVVNGGMLREIAQTSLGVRPTPAEARNRPRTLSRPRPRETLKTFENSLSLVRNKNHTHQELFIEFLSLIVRMMMIYSGLDE